MTKHIALKNKYINILGVLLILAIFVSLTIVQITKPANNEARAATTSTDPNLKVAFIGDDGAGTGYTQVLNLIKNENAAFVIDGGDLDYKNDPNIWDNQVNSVLGATYPYFVAMGNHDKAQWPGYAQKIQARLSNLPSVVCTGPVGVQQECMYRGLHILITAPALSGTGHDLFIKSKLAASTSTWKICSWHQNMAATQVGGKGDSVGWPVYEECRKGGAIIANAHEHSYHRTKTLIDIPNQIVDPSCNLPNFLCVALGKTFLFVSGLGGNSVRTQQRCLPSTAPYGCKGEWAKIYTSNQSATFGALFIIFNYNGDPNKAHGYFKNINNQIIDEFDISAASTPGPTSTPGSPTPTNTPPPPTISPPITIPPGSTALSLSLFLHGLGRAGDNVTPNATGNMNPLRTNRPVSLILTDTNNNTLPAAQGSVLFNSTSGDFKGTVNLGNAVNSGSYLVRVQSDGYLSKLYTGIQTITNGQTKQLLPLTLVTGDTNRDNKLSVLDYTLILDCFSDLAPPRNCADAAKKLATDITDDGSVNQFDYNLFLRELSVQPGQ